MTYLALTRMKDDDMPREWDVIGEGPQAMDAAKMLRDLMRDVGFRDSDMHAHCKDLVEGYTLTADNGRQFMVEQKPLGREIVEGPKAEVNDPILDLLKGDPWGVQDGMQRGRDDELAAQIAADRAKSLRWEDTLTPLQRDLYEAADKLMEVLEKVPKTTAHYAVIAALDAVRCLRSAADTVEMGD